MLLVYTCPCNTSLAYPVALPPSWAHKLELFIRSIFSTKNALCVPSAHAVDNLCTAACSRVDCFDSIDRCVILVKMFGKAAYRNLFFMNSAIELF
jgi:hypothetical protein